MRERVKDRRNNMLPINSFRWGQMRVDIYFIYSLLRVSHGHVFGSYEL